LPIVKQKTWRAAIALGAAAAMLLVVARLAFHDIFEPYTVRDSIALFA
jgi:hypothetical protein